ncbi:sugar transferase [Roseovarius sp. S4756]|uniref:sugar transferase n=1 Tax=Roseovarius maritimus TaxID=3342637 RepID=UPI00372A5D53
MADSEALELPGPEEEIVAPEGMAWSFKKALERSAALFLLALLLPLLLLIALFVKLDSRGPVLFIQSRFGQGGKPFNCYKFRTMHINECDQSGARQTADVDSRITRVGFVLRRASLDELPQIFNVIRGDMLLVGPRAHPCGMRVDGQLCEDLNRIYHTRHAVPPGITGWAQVNGSRGAVKSSQSLQRRVLLDRDYIRNWSLGRDLSILVRTLGVVFHRGHGV